MPDLTVLVESDLRAAVGLGAEERAAIEAVYPVVTAGRASMPPIMRIDVPEHRGEIDVKSAYLPGWPGIAVKVSAGFFDNPSRGLPSLGGLMMLFDSETGVPQAALFDNGFLTDLRTALAGAVAADHLARPDARRVAVLGAGVQAGLQVRALVGVRDLDQVVVWARRADAGRALADELADELGVTAEATGTVADALHGADIAVTTTPTTEPFVVADMLHPGLHVTAVGSDAEQKQELAADVLLAADVVVADRIDQSTRLGELRAAVAAGFDPDEAVELGAVIAGDAPGRTTPDQVTVCDLTGTGAQDTAIATLALQRCREAGRGTTLAT
ncbi:cyclodeaminase [Salsipaludibacter albus]|uniref:cyclodeaminase n=1 Tax=Salsipaludibacter albus TaxID=2849650 RepID=UPI001EE3CA0D|nr:cyclodeaminase [Salsipaludibacter albus]MBY5164230.1 cyclodeaminase [Salsipaludibacter albus]